MEEKLRLTAIRRRAEKVRRMGSGSGFCAPKVGSLKASGASSGDVENLLEVFIERIEQAFAAEVSKLDQKLGSSSRRRRSVSLTV